MAETIIATNAIERWNLTDGWMSFKKNLEQKYSKTHHGCKIIVKQIKNGNSGKGLIDYVIYKVEAQKGESK